MESCIGAPPIFPSFFTAMPFSSLWSKSIFQNVANPFSPDAKGATVATVDLRQHLLVLYLSNSCLASEVVAWAEYDGTGRNDYTGDERERPYPSGLAALRDGWRV